MFSKSGGIVAVVALVTFVRFSQGVPDNEECKNTIQALIVKQMDSFKWCLANMKFESKEERGEKMMCIMKCSMMREGLLEEDGTVDLANSVKLLNDFSMEFQNKIVDYLMVNCQKFVHDIDPKEETCKSYAPIIKCSHAMVNKVCKY